MSLFGPRHAAPQTPEPSTPPHWIDQWHFAMDEGVDVPVADAIEEPMSVRADPPHHIEDVIDLADADVSEITPLDVASPLGSDTDLAEVRRQLLLSAAALLEAVDQIDQVLEARRPHVVPI